MEIRDWVRAIGARLALIAVVAGVAAVLAGALALFQPEQYRATATVVLPDVPTFGPLTAAVGQRVANFESAVTSDGVLDAVAETTGEPRTSLDTVSSARGGTGNVLEVRFVGRDADRARQVVVAASREALLIQAETDAAFARAVADASEVAYDDAQQAYDALAQETGIFVSPEALLSSLEREVRPREPHGQRRRVGRYRSRAPRRAGSAAAAGRGRCGSRNLDGGSRDVAPGRRPGRGGAERRRARRRRGPARAGSPR